MIKSGKYAKIIYENNTINEYEVDVMKIHIFRSNCKQCSNGILIRDFSENKEGTISGEYVVGGKENAPRIIHEVGFIYDSDEPANVVDYINYYLWHVLGRCAYILGWWLRDAARQYLHYLDGTGTTRRIDYSVAYMEDSVIRMHIDTKIQIMADFAQKSFREGAGNQFEFIGGTEKIPNGKTENWQKTIGTHFVYGYGKATFDCDVETASMEVTIFVEDMYNFHKGRSDIASNISDNVNGRFVVLGWAKEFLTLGEIHFNVSWNYVKEGKTLIIKLG